MRTLTRSQMVLSIELHHHEIVIIEVNFDHTINPWDVHELPAIIEAGQRAVEENKQVILGAVANYSKLVRPGDPRPGPPATGAS
jgi:NTE family protein